MCIAKFEILDWGTQRGIGTLEKEDFMAFCSEKWPGINVDEQYASSFISNFKKRWGKAHRRRDRFVADNAQWLQTDLCLPGQPCQLPAPAEPSEPGPGGRPDPSTPVSFV